MTNTETAPTAPRTAGPRVDLLTVEAAEWLTTMPLLCGNGHRLTATGSVVELTDDTLAVLADLSEDTDGHYDGTYIWAGGSEYAVTPRTGRHATDQFDPAASAAYADRFRGQALLVREATDRAWITRRVSSPVPLVNAEEMNKHWNVCSVCGTSWSSTSPSNDCGAMDPAHIAWRTGR